MLLFIVDDSFLEFHSLCGVTHRECVVRARAKTKSRGIARHMRVLRKGGCVLYSHL